MLWVSSAKTGGCYLRYITAFLLALAFLSCSKNESIDFGGPNSPWYETRMDRFNYFVDARTATLVQSIPLTFTCDSLSLAFAVNGYAGGKASILIFADSLRYQSSDLMFNINYATRISLGCLPDSIRVELSRFAGQLSVNLIGIR